MKLMNIKLAIEKDELLGKKPEDIENSIKEEILKNVIEAITPMLNNEEFIEMNLSDDESEFNIQVGIIIGSSIEFTNAITNTTKNIIDLCLDNGTSLENAHNIVKEATLPLAELII